MFLSYVIKVFSYFPRKFNSRDLIITPLSIMYCKIYTLNDNTYTDISMSTIVL